MNLSLALRLAACIALGLATCLGIAAAGAVAGFTSGSEPYEPETVAVLAPGEAEALTYSRLRTSWCIDEIRMSRGMPREVSTDRLGIPSGGWGGQMDAARVTRLPRGCHPPQAPSNARSEFRVGWPARCLWSAVDSAQAGCIVELHGSVHLVRVWPVANPGRNAAMAEMMPFDRYSPGVCRFVPTGPIPLGLTVNTAAFAASWWLLLIVPTRARRYLRLRRRHCPNCNYDLRATAADLPCPECGRR